MTEQETEPVTADSGSPQATDSGDAPQRRRRWPLLAVAILTVAMLGAGAAVGNATVSYADSLAGRLLPGTTIAGVDVGGQTHAEALASIDGALAAELDREIVVRWKDRRWTKTARELGAQSDAGRMIAEVAASQTGLSWREWAQLRWLGERSHATADVRITYARRSVRRFVKSIAADVDLEPRDAALEVTGDDVAITGHRAGRKVRRRPVVTAVLRTLAGEGRPVKLRVRRLKPTTRTADFHEVLLLDQSEHRLTLFRDGERQGSWIVAVGTGDHPTPLGHYSVTLKRYLPTWVNPSPAGWGRDMPASIPPGPGNPLGVRALNWDAPAIRFHGTQAVHSLGTDASHGCVRMSNSDVTELYDLVDVGAVIVSRR